VNENELLYADIIKLTDEETGKKKEGYIDMSCVAALDIPIKTENEVKDQITQALKNEENVYYSDSLILDAYNYILLGRYNECIVVSNLALEIFILEILRAILRTEYDTDYELNQALNRVLETKLHTTVRKNFFANKKHDELMLESETYRKFDVARDFRRKVMHHGEKLNKDDAEKNINNIFNVNLYLIQNAGAFREHILKRAGRNPN
jgi:hypothetical protein